MNAIFRDAHPVSKLVLLGFFMVSSYLIILGISVLVASACFDAGWQTIRQVLEAGEYEEQLDLLRFLQIGYSAGLFLIPSLVVAWFISGSVFRYLQLDRGISLYTCLLVVILMIAALPLINFLSHVNYSIPIPDVLEGFRERVIRIDDQSQAMMDAFLDQDRLTGFLVNLLMIAVIPSIGEELLFRGLVQRIFSEWTRDHHAGVWIGAFLFSLMHLQFFGFLPRLLLGASFGYMLVWTGSMWVPVLAHLVNNSVAVVFFHLYYNGKISYDLDTLGAMEETNRYALLSFMLVLIFMIALYRVGKEKNRSL